VFLLEDASLLHLEFQASYLWEDLIRFAEYDLGLHRQHRCDVVTAIFYGPAVTRRPPPLHLRTLRFRPHLVLLGRRSGTQALRRLRAQVQEAVTLARHLPEREQGRVLGPILGLAYHYLGEAILNRLMEELMATSTMREYFAEAIEQGLERGMAQGLARGRVEAGRAHTLRVLAQRFGVIPADLEQRLSAVTDPARMDALFDAALSVDGIEEFASLLPDRP
jgi:hypothetical protein